MGFITYILKTPVRNICGDVAAFYKLNLKVAEARRASRVAYNRIVVDRGECRYGAPYANPFAGCVQQFWQWEYDIQMRMDIARQYELNCPKFSIDGWRCSYENCEYLSCNNLFFGVRRKLENLKRARNEFWLHKFARVK